MRLALNVATTIVLCLAISEGVLRVPALLAASQADFRHGALRARIPSDGRALHRVVCLGDSFTFGAGVAAAQTYPAALAARLDALAPERFEVINFGVKALDSTTANARIDALLSRVAPDSVVLWVGSNDRALRQEPDAAGVLEGWLLGLGDFSRLAMLLGEELQNRRFQQLWARELKSSGPRLSPDFQSPHRAPEEARAHAEANLREISERLRAAGVRLVLLSYPVNLGPPRAANEAIRRVGAMRRIPIVDTAASIARLPMGERGYLWAGHPNPQMYREIARDVANVLLQRVH